MSDGWKMKDGSKGYQRRLRRLQKMPKSYGVRAEAAPSKDRSAATNAIIVNWNMSRGRDITKVGPRERARGQSTWSRATKRYLETGQDGILERAARHVGDIIVKAYARHIKTGRGADGRPLKPVKPSTAGTKKRLTGRDDLPPMHRTGQLMRAFTTRVIKR